MRNFKEYRFVVGETHKDSKGNTVIDAQEEVSEVASSLGSAIKKAFINTDYKEVLRIIDQPEETLSQDMGR